MLRRRAPARGHPIDAKLRKTLQKELKELHARSGKTFIYITHSLEEAMYMSDRVGVLCNGQLKQVGTPSEIYNHPVSRFVASFIGDTNIFKVGMTAAGSWACEDFPGMQIKVAPHGDDRDGYLVVRPENLRVMYEGAVPADNVISCHVRNAYSMGSRIQYQLMSGKKEIMLELTPRHDHGIKPGDTISLGWNADDAIFVTE